MTLYLKLNQKNRIADIHANTRYTIHILPPNNVPLTRILIGDDVTVFSSELPVHEQSPLSSNCKLCMFSTAFVYFPLASGDRVILLSGVITTPFLCQVTTGYGYPDTGHESSRSSSWKQLKETLTDPIRASPVVMETQLV